MGAPFAGFAPASYGGIAIGGGARLLAGVALDPNVAADNGFHQLRDCSAGSLYVSTSDGSLWSKTAGPTPTAANGTWVTR